MVLELFFEIVMIEIISVVFKQFKYFWVATGFAEGCLLYAFYIK